MNDSEYFKKRYQLFIRFIKENNLYEEYRRIREKVSYITHILEICICIEQYNAWKKNVHKRTNITYADGSNGCKEQPNKKTNIQ